MTCYPWILKLQTGCSKVNTYIKAIVYIRYWHLVIVRWLTVTTKLVQICFHTFRNLPPFCLHHCSADTEQHKRPRYQKLRLALYYVFEDLRIWWDQLFLLCHGTFETFCVMTRFFMTRLSLANPLGEEASSYLSCKALLLINILS